MRSILQLIRRRRIRRDLSEEIEAHIAERVDELVEGGMGEREARQQARREFGNPTLCLETSREIWAWPRLERIGKDIRYGVRALRGSPLFTLAAILSLALGIGANTAVFTLLHASLWRPLPVRDPQQLVQVMRASSSPGFTAEMRFSYVLFQQLSEAARPMGEVFAKTDFAPRKFAVDGVANERVAGEAVSANFFSALYVEPVLGRLFEPQDDSVLGGNRVAVLSHAFWVRRFQSNPAILGKTILYEETPYSIVGVARPGFAGVEAEVRVDIWVPLTSAADKQRLTSPHMNWMRLLVRLRPGVDRTQVLPILEANFRTHIADQLLPSASPRFKAALAAQHLALRPAGSGFSTTGRKYEKPLLLLLAVVALVLLISCANVANLILARNAARRHEITVRLALGASRGRIVSQLFSESLLLSLSGAACGVLLAAWGTRLLLSLLPQSNLPLAFDLRPDSTVLGFTAAIGVASALLFGLAPALRAGRRKDGLSFRSGRRVTRPSSGGRLLVAGQLGVSLLLLIAAGIFLQTLHNLQRSDLGFRPENVATFDLSFPKGTSKDRLRQTYAQIRERLESHPGVVVASFAWPSVYGHGGWSNGIEVEGRPTAPGEDNEAGLITAGPGFFECIGLGLLQGRYLNANDEAGKPPVAVVNESLARYYFGAGSPLGRRIRLGSERRTWREIVGVVRDVKHYGVREKASRMVYLPGAQDGSFYVRGQINPTSLSAIIRADVAAADKTAQVERIRPFETAVDDMVSQERLTAVVSSVFGALAAVLAAIGLYGVVAYGMSRRTNEFGIRIALGAQRRDVERLVLRETIPLVFAGVGIGVAAALALARALSALISGMLYGIQPADVAVVTGSALLLIAIALLAGFLPAWRAARIDPAIALRDE